MGTLGKEAPCQFVRTENASGSDEADCAFVVMVSVLVSGSDRIGTL